MTDDHLRLQHVCAEIKDRRIQKGFTQLQVANYIGVSQNHYGRLENADSIFNIKQLFAVWRFLEMVRDV